MEKQKESKDYKVGAYVRLSKEDSTRVGESISIENQKLMLTKHVADNDWELIEIYQDDGFTGTNQKRPAFQRMIADVKSGLINAVLIKDLSRLGRNYLDVGNLAEVFLPEHGCELISLNEKLDDMMVFRNWFNEQHSKSTSTKVRAAKRVSAENGKFLGAYAPYGFKKDPSNRHKLIIDENTAPIVRKIFQMRASSMGFRSIAVQLNDDGIISPRAYYYQQQNRKNPLKNSGAWNKNGVMDIIQNEAYIGNLVSGKSGTISYKNHSQVRKDKEQWIRVEATHEPIIDINIWNKAQSLKKKKYIPGRRTDGEVNLFTGLLYCADCGFKLKGHVERRKRKDESERKTVTYMCSTYARSGKNACTIHSINEKALAGLVLDHIRSYARLVDLDEDRMIESIFLAQQSDAAGYKAAYHSEMESHKKQVAKLDLLIESLYEDITFGLIPDSLFKRQIEKYERERTERDQAATNLQKRIDANAIKPIKNNVETWTKLIKQYIALESLNIEMLHTLIDRIIVSQAQRINGGRACDVKIIYNYEP